MKKDKIIRGMVMVFLCSVNICGLKAQEKAEECVPADLKCEHLIAPLGIDRQAPRFSWHLEDSRDGCRQNYAERFLLQYVGTILQRNP